MASTAAKQAAPARAPHLWERATMPRALRARAVAARRVARRAAPTAAGGDGAPTLRAPGGGDSPVLYMDDSGRQHLGAPAGGGDDMFDTVRELQAESEEAMVRAAGRRLPALAEQRWAVLAANRRVPRLDRSLNPRAALRKSNHTFFQPRRHN